MQGQHVIGYPAATADRIIAATVAAYRHKPDAAAFGVGRAGISRQADRAVVYRSATGDVLIADTMDELRAQLPPHSLRSGCQPSRPPDSVELWAEWWSGRGGPLHRPG